MIFKNSLYKEIKGDASFRKFYRKKISNKSSIIVYTKKQKKKNLLIYDSINKLLINNKLIAPKLISQNYYKNYIEIQDFGDNSIFKKLKNKNINKLNIFKKIINLLLNIQKIKKRETKNFLNKNYKIPNYSNKKLLEEANLFLKWYIPRVIVKKNNKKLKKDLNNIFKKLLKNLKNVNNTFVHRDFHVSNLIQYKNKIAVIDSQDAIYGNLAYDLASLIDDVRFRSSNKLKEKIYNFFIKKKKIINKDNLKNDFEILSILRNLKIIGIFSRLSKRDKKNIYLKLIPYAWKLIELRIKKNAKFNDLKFLLDKYFPKKIRNLK